MASPALVPDPACLHLLSLEAKGQTILMDVVSCATEACCPLCQRPSERVHSRYRRWVADLPWANLAIQVCLHVRRFFCDNPACCRRIFTGRLPTVVVPYGRKTIRLVELLTALGFALGGEAGKRMSQQAGIFTSGDALLHQIRATPSPAFVTPRVLGVDDFSFLRGQVFGTIQVDLERHKPIDLLPDREAETFAAWLRAHPGVKIISRDRGGSYALGGRLGAPDAFQVADRFHVLQNLRDALERFFLRHRRVLRSLSLPPSHAQREVEAFVLTQLTPQEEASRQRRERFCERYEQVQDLANKRVAPTEIAKRLGVSRQTIYRYLVMDGPPEHKASRIAAFKLLEPFRPYLLRRWNEVIRNGQQLWREVVSQGYRHSCRSVERFVGQLRRETGQSFKFRQAAAAHLYEEREQEAAPFDLTALQAARLLIAKEEVRTAKERTLLERLCQADPAIEQTYQITAAFCQMLRTRQGARLDDWVKQAREAGIPELRSFAKSLLKDYDAVKAGLTLEWSQGQTEGQVQRLKFLKRQMYGRASFPVLRSASCGAPRLSKS
jgi:transposase